MRFNIVKPFKLYGFSGELYKINILLLLLQVWFVEDTHPSSYMIEKYTDELNRSAYRARFPRLEAKNVQLWFKNHRAKVYIFFNFFFKFFIYTFCILFFYIYLLFKFFFSH